MKSIGWTAKQMPMVFWSEPIAEWKGNPHVATGMDAEVTLPNGVNVVVTNVRYQGITGEEHRWQGQMSENGKPFAPKPDAVRKMLEDMNADKGPIQSGQTKGVA